MLQSKYIQGQTVPPFDAAISKALSSYGIEGGGKQMKIGVENLEGELYRVVVSVGLGAFVHATSCLLELKLKDELFESETGRNGFDSWFVVTPETLSLFPPEEFAPDDPASEILSEIEALQVLPETERQAIVQSRVGQGIFRTHLASYWKCCAVTGANCIPLLRASHIKPWRSSDNRERLDIFNGLLLSPNIDAAFDSGYITFDRQGKVVLSRAIVGAPAFQMHISAKLRINQRLLAEQHQQYLEYHRTQVFRDG